MSRHVHFADEEEPYNPLAPFPSENFTEVTQAVIAPNETAGMDANQKKLYELQIKLSQLKKDQNLRKYRNWIIKYNNHLQHLYRIACQNVPCSITFEQFCLFAYTESLEVPTTKYGPIRP